MSKRNADKVYNVTLVNKAKGLNTTIEVCGDEYILDAAEQQNIPLPYACHTGACVVCTGKIIQGSVDQSDHSFLREKELNAGFLLTCRAYPLSDCVILTHQEDELFEI
ncbi:MAG: 2Fe-2S iron-sulfur cluster-binding protein [Chamaesiphon sp.]